MQKKLYRLKDGRKISGVCAGLAEYFGIDVTIMRLIWIALLVFGFGTGLVMYVACIVIIPEESDYIDGEYKEK